MGRGLNENENDNLDQEGVTNVRKLQENYHQRRLF